MNGSDDSIDKPAIDKLNEEPLDKKVPGGSFAVVALSYMILLILGGAVIAVGILISSS